MWTFFLIKNYFAPIKNQLKILLLNKLSLNKFATWQLSLNKLAIIYYLVARQFIVNRANPRWKLHHPLSQFQEMGNLAGMRNLNTTFFY